MKTEKIKAWARVTKDNDILFPLFRSKEEAIKNNKKGWGIREIEIKIRGYV